MPYSVDNTPTRTVSETGIKTDYMLWCQALYGDKADNRSFSKTSELSCRASLEFDNHHERPAIFVEGDAGMSTQVEKDSNVQVH
jgi:hypothetical protein